MSLIRTLLRPLLSRSTQFLRDVEKLTVLQSLVHSQAGRQKTRIKSLADVEFSGFSQWGEDGIIDWLIERLPGIPETFIEFGVENYRESNTRLLLWLRNWRGTVIDGSRSHVENIRRQDVSWRFDLTAVCAFIDRDNINDIIVRAQAGAELGILSIDIDGNDYWVWKNISVVNPVIVICEYNAVFGDLRSITIPYRADFTRSKAHFSNLYFGASLKALTELASQKGYTFVGTNSNGCNAFFIRNDRAHEILSKLEGVCAHGSRIRESRDESGQLTFVGGRARLGLISHLPVFDLDQGCERFLSEVGDVYSDAWDSRYC